jgi:alkylhydroperoxidase/carboxymuconolactone decarboxylase family protein YurZ
MCLLQFWGRNAKLVCVRRVVCVAPLTRIRVNRRNLRIENGTRRGYNGGMDDMIPGAKERTEAMGKPFFVEALERNDAELLKQMQSLQDWAGRDGALPARIKTLMSLLGDAILGHAEGVRAIAQRARAEGATEQEIAETVRMAFLCAGLPGLITGTHAFGE